MRRGNRVFISSYAITQEYGGPDHVRDVSFLASFIEAAKTQVLIHDRIQQDQKNLMNKLADANGNRKEPATDALTIEQAFAIAQDQTERPGPERFIAWTRAVKVIIAAGFCPNCAQESGTTPANCPKLREWEDSNAPDENAGSECEQCEEFTAWGPQREYVEDISGHSDADPGL